MSDISTKPKEKTSLHRAAEWGYLDIVKYHIEEGADVNVQGIWGNIPLHLMINVYFMFFLKF